MKSIKQAEFKTQKIVDIPEHRETLTFTCSDHKTEILAYFSIIPYETIYFVTQPRSEIKNCQEKVIIKINNNISRYLLNSLLT